MSRTIKDTKKRKQERIKEMVLNEYDVEIVSSWFRRKKRKQLRANAKHILRNFYCAE